MKKVELKKYDIDQWGMSRPTAYSVKSGHAEFHCREDKKRFILA